MKKLFANEIEKLAKDFTDCSKVLTAIGDETRQHIILEMLKMGDCSGVEAALLAPTAINQQKFYFELLPNDTIKVNAGKGFYTKLDLGIAKYHFEVITGKKI